MKGSDAETQIYSENWTVETNSYGLVKLQIGATNQAKFEQIDWSDGSFFIAVTVDGELMGTSPMLSVSFVIQAQTVVN